MILLTEGNRAVIPQKWAGILTLPPISFPIPIGDILAAMQAASPPELPPEDLFLFQGLTHLPHKRLFVYVVNPN